MPAEAGSGTSDVAVAVAGCDILGESATWSVREQALYWVDIRGPALKRFDPITRALQSWPTPDLCCGVVLGERGVVVAGRTGLFRFVDGALKPLVEIEPATANNRLNEMRCDRQGRIWVGSMRDYGAAVSGALYRVTADLTVTKHLADVRIPNCLAWSANGRTMYFADTGDERIRAFEYDVDAGLYSSARDFFPAGGAPGRPDGGTVDREDYLWNARPREGVVVRIAPNGSLDRVVRLPVSIPTCCALGGEDLKTLYITTARQRLSEEELARQPLAGSLFALRVETPGLPEAEFRG